MTFIKKYIGALFLTPRFYLVVGACIVLFIVSFFYAPLLIVPQIGWYVIVMLLLIDYFFLFITGRMPMVKRVTADRFSNSDENKVTLQVINMMAFELDFEIIDELPVQFQKRDWIIYQHLAPFQQKNIVYSVRPTQRGEYYFGNMKAGGTDGLKDGSPLATKMAEVYSSVDVWKNDFFKVGAMRGVGWAVLFQDPETKTVSNHWITLHEEGNVAGFVPLLVMDVWEHAWLKDYKPADRPKYIEAFYSNIDWAAVEKRMVK